MQNCFEIIIFKSLLGLCLVNVQSCGYGLDGGGSVGVNVGVGGCVSGDVSGVSGCVNGGVGGDIGGGIIVVSVVVLVPVVVSVVISVVVLVVMLVMDGVRGWVLHFIWNSKVALNHLHCKGRYRAARVANDILSLGGVLGVMIWENIYLSYKKIWLGVYHR